MEKSDRPVNKSWFGEGEIIDAELLVDLLETYRFGKNNVPAGRHRSKAAATVPALDSISEIEDEEAVDGSQEGNKSVHESISSAFSRSDPIILLETTVSETGSSEESGYNWLESNSTSLPNVENERQQSAEDGELEEEGEKECGEVEVKPKIREEKDGEVQVKPSIREEKNVEIDQEGEEKDGDQVEVKSSIREEKDGEIEEEEAEKSDRSSSESEEKSNLEKLLATQENYELYCPSCSSCITRKVILKERLRGNLVDLSADLKPDVPVDEAPDEPSDTEEMDPPVKVHVLPHTLLEDDDQKDKEKGNVFRCLACLKYFIRLGARFLQLDYNKGKPVEEPEVNNIKAMDSINTTQVEPDRERFAIELLKSTVYGGISETITSLGVVSSASASGSSTENIFALAVANLAGGLVVLAQNLQDLRNNSDQEKDRYQELLGRRANFRMHILVAVMSYIFFGLIPPLVYAFSFYETGIKNYKLISVFAVSLVCVILLGMIKVYVRKPPNSCESTKSTYLKSAAFYTSIVIASSGISYVVGDIMGEHIRKLGWFSLDRVSITSPFDGIKPEDYRFTSF